MLHRDDDEAPAPYISHRRTTSSRRPGHVSTRPVIVRVLRVVPCSSCGGRRHEGSKGPHAVHSNLRGQLVDCAGTVVERCPRCSSGYHAAALHCPSL